MELQLKMRAKIKVSIFSILLIGCLLQQGAAGFGEENLKPTKLYLDLEENGDTLNFSGSLVIENDNLGILNENVIIYRIEREDNIPLGIAETGENGKFQFYSKAPKKKGIFRYEAAFMSTKDYAKSKSDGIYNHNLDSLYVLSISIVFFLAIVTSLAIFTTRGFRPEDWLTTTIIGGFVALFAFILLGIIGVFVVGLFIGYIFSKRHGGWKNQIKVGLLCGAITYMVYGLLMLSSGLAYPETINLSHSISQGSFIVNFLRNLLPSGLAVMITTGFGAIIGEKVRNHLDSTKE